MAEDGLSAYFVSSHSVFRAGYKLLSMSSPCLFIWRLGVGGRTWHVGSQEFGSWIQNSSFKCSQHFWAAGAKATCSTGEGRWVTWGVLWKTNTEGSWVLASDGPPPFGHHLSGSCCLHNIDPSCHAAGALPTQSHLSCAETAAGIALVSCTEHYQPTTRPLSGALSSSFLVGTEHPCLHCFSLPRHAVGHILVSLLLMGDTCLHRR
jgi:hypothetical protein